MNLTPGVCRFCGCTEAAACPGGCRWMDAEETLCSACVPHLDRETLDLLARAEMEAFGEYPLEMQMTVADVTLLIGALHLALRHPQFPPTTAQAIRAWIAQVGQGVRLLVPGLAEVVARGDNPAHDIPVSSTIILPEEYGA